MMFEMKKKMHQICHNFQSQGDKIPVLYLVFLWHYLIAIVFNTLFLQLFTLRIFFVKKKNTVKVKKNNKQRQKHKKGKKIHPSKKKTTPKNHGR